MSQTLAAPLRLLVTLPHDTLLRAEGHLARFRAVLGLLSDHEVGFVVPDSVPPAELERLGTSKLFPFREPGVLGRRVPYGIGLSPSFRAACRDAAAVMKPHLLICDFPWGGSALSGCSAAPLVYLSHGVEQDFVDTTLLHLGIRNRLAGAVARRLVGGVEARTCRAAKLVVTMSSPDAERYQSLYELAPETLLPLPQPVALAPFGARDEEARGAVRRDLGVSGDSPLIVFHGSWFHVPNRRAFSAVREAVAPAVRARFPEAVFVLAGSGLAESRSEGIRSLGFVPDLGGLLRAADLAFMPIFDGAGVRMKTFDYVAAELPIVGTQKALEGVGFVDGTHALVAQDTIPDVTRRLVEALERPFLWRRMATAARAFVATHHDPTVVKEQLDACLRTLLPAGSSDKRARAPRGS